MTPDVPVALESTSSRDLLPALQVLYRSIWLKEGAGRNWDKFEADAFARLREMIIGQAQLTPAAPRRNVKDDQIVWARSPVRLDLAGGWTDTPPYCLEYGGRVVNLAVDLNGQPPIQVFVRPSKNPEIVLRSIDLGSQERVLSFEELD